MRRYAALVVVAVLTLTGCSGLEGTNDGGYITGNGEVVLRAVADRDAPVELSGEDLAGEPLDLADLRGKPTVVVVWGSWCPPCVAEAPEVVAAAEELGAKAHFVGINLRESAPEMGQAFERNYELPYPSFFSPDGREMLAFAGALTPRSIPSFAILDDQGRVAATIGGRLPSTTTLVDLVEDVSGKARASG